MIFLRNEGLFGFGGSSTKIDATNKMITDTTTSVMSSMSSTGSGQIVQTQSIVASGPDSKNIGVTLDQIGSINLSLLANSDTNAKMQTQIVNDIVNKLASKNSAFPVQFSDQKNSTTVRNIVDSHVSANLSTSVLSKLSLSIAQNQSVVALSGGVNESVRLSQKADGIGKAVASMASSMTAELMSKTSTNTDVKVENTSAIADMFKTLGDMYKSFMDGINGIFKSVFTMSPGFVIMVVAGIVGIIALGYFALGGLKTSKAKVAK